MMAIGCLVLAAGLSSRMGDRFKLLLPWSNDRLVLQQVIETVQKAEIEPIVVITGHRAENVKNALVDHNVQFDHNPDYATGEILSSLKVGLRAMPDNVAGVLVMPGDLPLISAQTIQQVSTAFQPERIVVPRCAGKRGHPVLFPRRYWSEILALSADQTPRAVIQHNAKNRLWLDVDDVGSITDIDTPEAYEQALQLAGDV